MSKSEYDIGYEDGKNGHPRQDKETLGEIFLGLLGLRIPDDFNYDEYNRGYDDGVEATN